MDSLVDKFLQISKQLCESQCSSLTEEIEVCSRASLKAQFESKLFSDSPPDFRDFISSVSYRRQALLARLERLKKLLKWYGKGEKLNVTEGLKDELRTSFISSSEIIFTTLSSSAMELLFKVVPSVDVVVIDEAAQAVELSALIPMQYNPRKVILVGDPQQLPATVISKNSSFERSLFERFELSGHRKFLLETQYRMRSELCEFPSLYFYHGRLKTGVPDAPALFGDDPWLRTFRFFDISFGRENREKVSPSNRSEARIVGLLLRRIVRQAEKLKLPFPRVAVLTPYRQQQSEIRREMREAVPSEFVSLVSVDTVDAFQGQVFVALGCA